MLRQSTKWLFVCLVLILVLAACVGPAGNLPTGSAAGGATAGEVPEEDTFQNAPLQWQGFSAFGDGDPDSCKSLRMSIDGRVEIGPCDSEGEVLEFPGQAELDSPAWRRAIESWVEFTYGQQATGRVSASTRTVMSWWLGDSPDQPGYCRHLLVLAYGYAYANVDPCEAGPVLSHAEGWLQTDELEAFDAWLYNRAPIFLDRNYFAGEGDAEVSDEEVERMAQWAQAVYDRISSQETALQSTPGRGETALIWEGYTEMGGVDEKTCAKLTLTDANVANYGLCSEPGEQTTLSGNKAQEWVSFRERLASFALEMPEVHLLFGGLGQEESPAWQRALATWAEYTFAELASGRVSASARSMLSWWPGELADEPGACAHLVILAHGYAYADVVSCEGGVLLTHAEGWLQTDEMEVFDAWLYNRAPVYMDDNYFSGQGDEEMAEAEIAALAEWVEAVYARIAEATLSFQE